MLQSGMSLVQVFQQAQGCEQGDMQHMLQASISSLDEGFLADTHIPSLVCMPHSDRNFVFYDNTMWMRISSALGSVVKLRCQFCTEAIHNIDARKKRGMRTGQSLLSCQWSHCVS